jgi:nucleotide-sensitive chloride channel 1A
MPLELVTEAPQEESFTPLSEHQAQTPATFFGARPVLHHHSPRAKLAVRNSEYGQHEVLQQMASNTASEAEDVILEVDAWITSKYSSRV